MTSASSLFSNHLRSRSSSRNPNPNQSDTTLHSDLHHSPHRRRRHRVDGGPSRHRLLDAEHELLQSDSSSNPKISRAGNGSNSRPAPSRANEVALTRSREGSRANESALSRSGEGNERLPDTVLQAQGRLLARLHGISLTSNRQNINTSSISRNEFVLESDFGSISFGDWDIESDTQFTGFTAGASQAMPRHNVSKKKPPGLSQEAICSLPQENFQYAQETESVASASLECSICLDKFCPDDWLFRLPCYHRFHCSCLETWLQNCGDCPCCRASI